MSAKAEQRQRSHETILDSAARLLRERGIVGARVADVMKGAGLTVGGFYAHFDSKEALIDEALRRTASAWRERMMVGLEERPITERAELLLKRYLSSLHRDEAAEGCPFPAIVGEIATSAPEHRPVLAEQVQRLAAALEANLPEGRALSKKQLSLGLVALMVGGLTLARGVAGTALSDEFLKAARALGNLAVRANSKP